MTDLPAIPQGLGPPGLGLDVEPLPRWRALHADPVGWGRLQRTFTPSELDEIAAADDPAATAAARWVAKEAVVKALHGAVGMREVEVLRDHARGLVVARPTLPGHAVHVSVSHTRDHVFGAAWSRPRGERNDATTSSP